MRRELLCALALTCSAPALAQEPSDYDQAVTARIAGEPERAIALLQPVLAADPDNTDARLQLGLALLALNRLDEAEQAFRAVLAAAPDYADARVGLARVAQRRGDAEGALAELDRVDPAYPGAAVLREQLEQPRWSLDIDGSYSTLEGASADWKGVAVRLRRQVSPSTAVAGRIEFARRFDMNDIFGEARIDRRLSEGASIYAALGGTPNADFLPQWQVALGGALRVRGGGNATVLTLDTRFAEYATGDVQAISPGVEQYLAQGRVWLTGRWINLFDENGDHRSGYLARVDGLATDRLRLFAGYSNAPDTSEGVVIDTEAVFGGISFDLDDRTTLRISAAHEDRETGSDRTQFDLGLGLRF